MTRSSSGVAQEPLPIDEIWRRLESSSFRRRFRLQGRELAYLQTWGLARVMEHAAGFVNRRLAPAVIANDGRQTPWRNHPVFVAQHATATCCRGCLAKTHGIPSGRELSRTEVRHVLDVLERWLRSQL